MNQKPKPEFMSAHEGAYMFRLSLTSPSLEHLAAIEEAIANRYGPIVDGIRRRLDQRLEELMAGEEP
jgi:hypothetical protein